MTLSIRGLKGIWKHNSLGDPTQTHLNHFCPDILKAFQLIIKPIFKLNNFTDKMEILMIISHGWLCSAIVKA